MENNFRFIVYQTTNIVNNKIYIGVHRISELDMFDGYIGCGVNIRYSSTYMNPKTPFQQAVKKYGIFNFKRRTLYVFDKEEDAYAKEAELVSQEFINRHDTYNACLGGKQPIHMLYNHIYQFDINGRLVKEWNNVYDVSDFLKTWKQTVYSAIHNKQRLFGFYWSYDSHIDITTYSNPNSPKNVYKYNKEGKCIAIFNSIGEAARQEQVTSGHIIKRIKTGSLSKDCYYSYELYDEYIPKPRLSLEGCNIHLYDLEGNYCQTISVKEFKKVSKVHTYKEISDTILNKSTIIGYQLRLEKVGKIDPYSPKNKKRAVLVNRLDGTFSKEYESVTSACKELGLDHSTVSKILRGCANTTKGYTIKYRN